MTQTTRAGFAVFLGAPNAGKSTLLNQILGEKLSIVSSKAQTTRTRVLGLWTEGEVQVGLIDTPGLFAPKGRLDRAMVDAAWQGLDDADAAVLLVDASARQPDPKVEAILENLTRTKRKLALALNKTDRIHPEKLLPLAERFNQTGLFDEIFMLSALTGDGVDALKAFLRAKMPVGPWLYPEDQLTDVADRLLAAETTREQLFHQLYDELPYQATVVPESWTEKDNGSVVIHQTILVTRQGHKAIVLGHQGQRIKAIGQKARTELAALLGRPVHLFLDVKVDPTWQEKASFYALFGLETRGKA
jgi:GTP-binding protein Era